MFGGSGGQAGKGSAPDGSGGRVIREIVLEEGKYVQVRPILLYFIFDFGADFELNTQCK